MKIEVIERDGEKWIIWCSGQVKVENVPALIHELQRLVAKEQDERQ